MIKTFRPRLTRQAGVPALEVGARRNRRRRSRQEVFIGLFSAVDGLDNLVLVEATRYVPACRTVHLLGQTESDSDIDNLVLVVSVPECRTVRLLGQTES